MTYKILRAELVHLPWMRLLYGRWLVEQPYAYPQMDPEELDNFVVTVANEMLTNPDNIACFVAIKGRRVVGFIASEITTRKVGKPHRAARVHWIYVVPNHRKGGVAAQLIHAGMEWAIAAGLDTVEVAEAGVESEWMRRMGFQPFATHYVLPFAQVYALSQQRMEALKAPRQPMRNLKDMNGHGEQEHLG